MPGAVATVLALAVALVLGFAWGQYYESRRGGTAQRETQRLSCDACGTPCGSWDRAREHALSEHKVDELGWRDIISEA